MKALLRVVLAVVAVLAAVLSVNAVRLGGRQIEVARADERGPDPIEAAQRLAQAIRFQTVSNQDPAKFPAAEFDSLQAFLAGSFPRVQAAIGKERTGDFSLLYEWRGTDPALKPILLMAHQDVVPADPAATKDWTHPPFAGDIVEGFVWGRGTLDDKGSVMALHEAAEALLAQGFQPKRTVYFVFGHDEEVGGRKGSAQIADKL